MAEVRWRGGSSASEKSLQQRGTQVHLFGRDASHTASSAFLVEHACGNLADSEVAPIRGSQHPTENENGNFPELRVQILLACSWL